jgi:hypothetical protein
LDDDNNDKFNLEQIVLIDRIADWWVGDPLYEPAILNDSNRTKYSPMLITGDEGVNETLDGKIVRPDGFLQRFAKRDSLLVRAVDSTWWVKAEGDRGVTVLALPYLPFFSNCRGYDNHIYISKLLENHPNCTRKRHSDVQKVDPIFFDGDLGPIEVPQADECSLNKPQHGSLRSNGVKEPTTFLQIKL